MAEDTIVNISNIFGKLYNFFHMSLETILELPSNQFSNQLLNF